MVFEQVGVVSPSDPLYTCDQWSWEEMILWFVVIMVGGPKRVPRRILDVLVMHHSVSGLRPGYSTFNEEKNDKK